MMLRWNGLRCTPISSDTVPGSGGMAFPGKNMPDEREGSID